MTSIGGKCFNMKMLVANAGSSSFKSQLLDMPGEKQLAKLRIERLGTDQATVEWTDRSGATQKVTTPLLSYTAAVEFMLEKLADPATGVLSSVSELDAVAFKPVYAKGISGCQYMDKRVLDAMAEYCDIVAPLHNPAYIEAIESFTNVLPNTPMVGLFEDFFFDQVPDYVSIYPIPWDWSEKYGIRKRFFHSASHYYVANRAADLMGRELSELNLITCHLGGSSSIQCIQKGIGVEGCGGFTLQAGVPQSVRPGDLDSFLIAYLVHKGEGTILEVINKMMTEGGLAGISGIGFDMRDLQQAAESGHERAKLAIDSWVHQVRKYIGSWLVMLGHTDAITIAGGTGEASAYIRKRVLQGCEELGIVIDDARNEAASGKEALISADNSRIQVWVIPTNEEIVVARECYKLLTK